MKFNFAFVLFLISFSSFSQELNWTGNAGNADFFDEQNWINTQTNTTPSNGAINPNTPIGFHLNIADASTEIQANGIINLTNSSLSIENAELFANAISGGELILNTEAYVSLSDLDAIQNNSEIELNSPIAWLQLLQLKPDVVFQNHMNQFKTEQNQAVYQANMRLDNYYENGTIVRSISSSEKPLQLFAEENLQGNSAEMELDVIHSGNEISNNFNNSAKSFQLKKGHMVTFAENEDGTGKSKNYIASEEDLIINDLPNYLKDKISFVRVLPWNWVAKKGRGGGGTSTLLNNTWFYHWNNTMDSTLELENAPMSWGANGANTDAAIQNYLTKYKSTHVLAFNESDNCNDQSGQYNNLCQVPVAVAIYENLMKTGMRLVSPNGRENAPFGWLKDFYDQATKQDIRIDVIGVHWYDWGSNPANSPNADANEIFQRFLTYLENVHDFYNLPIWITEFNANPNRTNQVNYEFMQLALPYLESLDYVERYAWFEPNSDVADYTDSAGNLTNVGSFYTNQESTPAIPEANLSDNSNIDNFIDQIDPTGENLIVNGFFESGDLFGWEGINIGILTNNNANIFEGTTSGRILANVGELYQIIEVEPNTVYDFSLYTKWFVPPSEAIDVAILNTADDSVITSQEMTTSTSWNLIEFEFTTPSDGDEIKFIVAKGNEPGWFIDNAVMHKIETLSFNLPSISRVFSLHPNPSSGQINISSQQNLSSISIFNLQGKLIKEVLKINKKEIRIELENISSGVYFVQSTNRYGNKSIQKLIIY